VGIVAFVWLRQQREVVEEEVEDPGAQREELLDAIAELDDDFEAGAWPRRTIANSARNSKQNSSN